jgi:hypothetical protein
MHRSYPVLISLCVCFAAQPLPCCADESRVQFLRTLNTDPSEPKRLSALAELEKGAPLESTQITRSITDTCDKIRAAMIRLGAPLAATDPDLELRLIALAHDRSPVVQLQMLKTLPTLKHPSAAVAYRKLLAAARLSTDTKLKSYASSLSSAE